MQIEQDLTKHRYFSQLLQCSFFQYLLTLTLTDLKEYFSDSLQLKSRLPRHTSRVSGLPDIKLWDRKLFLIYYQCPRMISVLTLLKKRWLPTPLVSDTLKLCLKTPWTAFFSDEKLSSIDNAFCLISLNFLECWVNAYFFLA